MISQEGVQRRLGSASGFRTLILFAARNCVEAGRFFIVAAVINLGHDL